MTEILFYHLEQAPLERVLPQLLEKTLERGWKAIVEVGNQERIAALDTALWTWNENSFLPHDVEGTPQDQDQPVLLTHSNKNTNNSEIRFFVDRAVPKSADGYTRLVYMFDGHDPDAVSEARTAWKALSADHDCTYWQQEPSGKWVKKG